MHNVHIVSLHLYFYLFDFQLCNFFISIDEDYV